MKAKRLISLLLCLIMVVGTLPMSVMAEGTAATAKTSEKVKFNEFFDFNAMDTDTAVSTTSLDTMINDKDLFYTSIHQGSSNLSFVDVDGNGDMALKTPVNTALRSMTQRLRCSRPTFYLNLTFVLKQLAETPIQFSSSAEPAPQKSTKPVLCRR